jgi:hypothetical protein
MSNNPQNRKLSNQFGAITGPSDSELSDIETQGEGSWYTPERIDAMRDEYAKLDPNYAAVRNARQGRRGTGGEIPTSSAIGRGGLGNENMNFSALSDSSSAMDQTRSEGAQHGVDTSVDMGSSGDAAGARYAISGSGMGGWDADVSKRASSFDRVAPRSKEETQAKQQGLFFLQVAGPTCNHPVCQSYRARGTEMLGRFLGTDRRLDEKQYGTAQNPEQAIPSVRTDKKVATYVLRPESADVPSGQRKGSFGTGKTDDFGDFQPDKKNPVITPVTQVMDSNHPQYKSLMAQYRTLAGAGERPLFHPDDYLEHHHAPGEENFKLPWEA